MKSLIILIIIIISLAGNCLAIGSECSVQCENKTDSNLTLLGITVDSSSWMDVIRTFGPAKHFRTTENSDKYLCYTSYNQNDTTAVVFMHYTPVISSVEIYAYSSQIHPDIPCTPSKIVNKDIQLDSGVKLFSSTDALYNTANSWTYQDDSELVMYNCCQTFDAAISPSLATNYRKYSAKTMRNIIYYINIKKSSWY